MLFINADAEFHAGRAQNYLRPEHVEKIVSTFERFEDMPGYARRVSLDGDRGAANDCNLNIRRYVDNSPPPEPHDVRAHLLGGVPVAEVEAKRPLFEALGFDPGPRLRRRATTTRPTATFAPGAHRRAPPSAPLIENDPGVQARVARLARTRSPPGGPSTRRASPICPSAATSTPCAPSSSTPSSPRCCRSASLDRFKLAGVIATWWTDTLPDFKTLLENGFPGVIDGWVDAIADAVEDDEAAGPAFDPFAHKLVRRTMADYLERIADAKADIARLKGEKEAFEQSNPPDDADEEELEPGTTPRTWIARRAS